MALDQLYRWMRASWNAAPSRRGTGLLLKPVGAVQSLGWVLLVWVPVVTMLIASGQAGVGDWRGVSQSALVVSVGAILSGVWLMLHARRAFVFFNARGIVLRTALGRMRHLSWARVAKVEYHSVRARLSLRSDRSTLIIGLFFDGLSSLATQMRSALPRRLVAEPLGRLESNINYDPWSGSMP